MTSKRAILLERFRARSRERVRGLRTTLGLDDPRTDESFADLLGALHTLKGEARMLGLASMATAAHAIEEDLHSLEGPSPEDRRATLDDALSLLDAMLAAELVEDERAERTSTAIGLALRGDAGRLGAREAAPEGTASRPARPETSEAGRRPFVDVPVADVEALCEGAEGVRSALARAVAAGQADRATLAEILARLERHADDLWELRLSPVAPTLASLAAHAEDLARAQGKALRTHVEAEGAALDRAVLEALTEPLLHLVRNAVDHGLELPAERGTKDAEGRLRLSAVARGGGVSLVVSDDGRGIDVEAVRRKIVERRLVDVGAGAGLTDDEVADFVFRPGFSTREIVSEVSGRGVGLDVVRRVAESLGGGASVRSRAGEGSRFVVTVPVGLARERVLLVPIGDATFGLSARLVRGVVTTRGRVVEVPLGSALDTGEGLVPLRSLASLVGHDGREEEPLAILVEIAERTWALGVASVAGEHDVLRRPADRALASFGWASASGVLDDGRVVLLPSLAELLRTGGARSLPSDRRVVPSTRERRRSALVVDDSPIVRDLVAELLSAAGLAVTQAEDGEAALSALDRSSYDVIVSDVEMPRVDGLELLRRVRSRSSETPFVLVTTRGSAEDRRRATELGASGYVVKTDFHEGDLVSAVLRLVGEAP